VLSAPAGTGKTTLVKRLAAEFPHVVQSVSYTSRKRRPHEKDGIDYHFVTQGKFEEKLSAGDFLEHAKVYEDYYGTDRRGVDEQLEKGNHVFCVIDTQGAQQLKGKVPAVFIFVFPPSLEELEARLTKRQTESPEIIEERLSWAVKEIEAGKHYQYQVVNDDLETAYEQLRQIVIAEEKQDGI